MTLKLELWLQHHRAKCANVSKDLDFWYSSKNEDLIKLED